MSGKFVLMAVAAGALLTAGTAHAQNAKAVVGTLTCKGSGSVGAIFGSKQTLRCAFDPDGAGGVRPYTGSITRVGIDIGVTGPSTMVWTVLASTNDIPSGALDGNYAGVSADASVGVGVGANALIGGSNDSIVLQPVSVKGQTGLNLAVGVAELSLRAN